MVKKITLVVLILFTMSSTGQSFPGDQYNGFSSRSFMKFNSFLTVPTFSVLYGENPSIQLMSRSANIEFQDASRLHTLSYSGRMKENIGAGIAVFQQEVGVFKDFGAIANYVYQVQLNQEMKVAFGFNFFYSRRGIDRGKELSNGEDPIINNYQDKPVVVFQPALTLSYGKIFAGLFLENITDFNLKKSNFVTSFAGKTYSAHLGYGTDFEGLSGLFANTNLKIFAVARKSGHNGFTYAANALLNLPKAGWGKFGYDNFYGLNAGLGVNLSERLSIGFSYEKRKGLGGTNEVGLIYNFGGKRRGTQGSSSSKVYKPKVEVVLPSNTPAIERRTEEYKNPEHNDISDEIRIAQDSINRLNRKVEEVLRLLQQKPKIIRDTVRVNVNQPVIIRDTVKVPAPAPRQANNLQPVRRNSSSNAPWRQQTVVSRGSGGGGTFYYVAVDMFSSEAKARKKAKEYKRRKVNARYVKDAKTKKYYVYINRFSKRKDADRVVKEINGAGTKSFEDNEENDLGVKVKAVSKDNVYVAKVTTEGSKTYRRKKRNPPAKVLTMGMMDGLEEGYYLVVNVFANGSNAEKFTNRLRADGIDANYFLNPRTGSSHVYILKTKDRAEIIKLYKNNLNGSYYDSKSIIHIR